ncbi:MAG: radical SAM protein [Alphaproteobacteria bacterium]|nr:radical SAM protein [Alphaproteobacteria bacterium]
MADGPSLPTVGAPSAEQMLEREQIANRKKHWVRAVTACNSRCLFCLDADTPRNVYIPVDDVKAELRRGIEQLGADKVIISGGEATLHPQFVELVRYAKQDLGYDRVQTVTNGTMLADRDFYVACRDAGLGEITFSLHGHTEDLHDWLTQTPGGFKKLMKGMIRARRDPRGPIVNVDVCINKQNVAFIDKVVELCLSVGVNEFDLLHVIPQANAFENRELMFYDVREHLPTLQKVFRLNRHRGVTVWTNRFPVHFLEGMEDLIQDPHKMLDEVNGRRFMVRNYLDVGQKLECRDPERCVHCFIEPFCTTMDRRMAELSTDAVAVWDAGPVPEAGPLTLATLGVPQPVPYGVDTVAVELPDMDALVRLDLPLGVEARVELPGPVPAAPRPLRLVADRAAQLDAWVGALPAGVGLVVDLNRDTAAWMLDHRAALAALGPRLRIHQPGWEHMRDALERDVRDPADFFAALDLRVACSGLAPCQAPGTELVDAPARLSPVMFDADTGRLSIRELARDHVARAYRAKSVRCADCALDSRCDGVHINMIRDQGLKQCRPLSPDDAWGADALAQLTARWPTPRPRVGDGKALEPAPPSLPGHAQPTAPVADPLAETANALGRLPKPLVKGPTRVKTAPRADEL